MRVSRVAPCQCSSPGGVHTVSPGRIELGKVFDLELPLDDVAEAYAAMDERRAIKVLVRP